MDENRIEKTIVLKATRERVWRAISDSARFGRWFGVEIDGPFIAGKEAVGRMLQQGLIRRSPVFRNRIAERRFAWWWSGLSR